MLTFARKPEPTQRHSPPGRNLPNPVPVELPHFAPNFNTVPPHAQAPINLQPKLAVSTPGDANEWEADHTADRVMRMPEAQLRSPCACGGGCPGCRARPARPSPPDVLAEREGSGGSADSAASSVAREGLPSAGRPLDPETRAFMEPRFGRDFGRVRVHTGERAAAAARMFRARALTVGNDIVFGAGQYRPDTDAGRRLLAHELTHVTQQNHDVVHRKPGVDPEESWQGVVASPFGVESETDETRPVKRQRADEAKRRMLEAPEGRQLINQLWQLFCGRRRRCQPQIHVAFVDQLPGGTPDSSDGLFEPAAPDSPPYYVWVRNREPVSEEERARTLPSSYKVGRTVLFSYSYQDAESNMASTLHHELLHVWYINTQDDPLFPTGHGDVAKEGQISEVFAARLRAFAGEMDEIEGRMRQAAEARRAEEEQRARASEQAPVAEGMAGARRPDSGPGLFGGQLSLQGGVVSVGAIRGTAIVGADLVLGQINSLRLGPRGIYLTPSHLLLGGAVGYRRLQEGDQLQGRVENPLFFDVEAGILVEMTPADAARITNHFAVVGSASIGQEYGRSGARFFWQVGGMIVITDRGEVGGGGAAGLGVRF